MDQASDNALTRNRDASNFNTGCSFLDVIHGALRALHHIFGVLEKPFKV
jgi:hypothetical protein